MTKSAYLRMPDINKKRRDGVDYVATSIGPKKTQVYLPVIFESINEGKVTYKLKGFTNTKMDELDAELSRLGIKGTPDFNKMTYTIHMKGSNTHMLDKLMKKKGGKKIKESVNEAQNELISTSKDIKTYKGKKVPKGKYEVINARGQFATLMRIHDKVDGGNVYNLVPLNTLSKVASRLKESINEAPGNNHKDQYVGQARVKVEPYTYKNQVRNFHDVSMYRNHKKPYNYYLSIVLAHNKTTAKVDYIVDTGTHILSKAGKWAQNFIKRRMSGTGRERFS
jgi:5'(3')-deoxyribonucleotidase